MGVKNFGFTEKQKNIKQGSTKLKELHVCIMRVQKKMAAELKEPPCLYHACSKEDGGLAVGSAVKCRKAIFTYVAKRKSSSCTLYVC